jgi:hypothetical protein
VNRYAIVHGGRVINVIESAEPPEDLSAFPEGSFAFAHDRAGPGWTYAGGQLVDPTPPPVPQVPQFASAGSFMRACVRLGWYDAISAFVNAIPGTQGRELQVLLLHAVEYRRQNADLIFVAHQVGMDDAEIDAVFVLADELDRAA